MSSQADQDMEELLASVLPEEGDCLHPDTEETIEETFIYNGSALDPFEVKNARVLKCKSCQASLYRMIEAKGWSIAKAKELIERGGRYRGNEVRFLWQVTGLSLNQFADEMHLFNDVMSSRRTILVWEKLQVPEEWEKSFIDKVQHWLEREEVWNNHCKEKYNKAGN